MQLWELEVTNVPKKYGWAIARDLRKSGKYQRANKRWVGSCPSLGEFLNILEEGGWSLAKHGHWTGILWYVHNYEGHTKSNEQQMFMAYCILLLKSYAQNLNIQCFLYFSTCLPLLFFFSTHVSHHSGSLKIPLR